MTKGYETSISKIQKGRQEKECKELAKNLGITIAKAQNILKEKEKKNTPVILLFLLYYRK